MDKLLEKIDNLSLSKKVIDLFAGTGAFSHSLSYYDKFECVFSNDKEKSSEKIYNLNNNHSLLLKDINDINVEDIPKHNILCCGPPCQPFSISGNQRGFEDPRSNVFWKLLDIIDFHSPEVIIIENVKNFKTHDSGKTYKTIADKITDKGYFIKCEILDTAKITSLPHHRERIYIICFKDKKMYDSFDFVFPIVEKEPISSFLEEEIPEKYYYTDKLKVYDEVKKNVVKHIDTNTLYQYRRYYVRENMSNVCPTLTANMGGGGHNVPLLLDGKGIRKLTPRECFNLQGFPENYKLPDISDSSLYKLAGNAVSVPVVKLIFEKLDNLI